MIPFNFFQHYSFLFRYQQFRQNIRNEVQNNNFENARVLINNIIAEHDPYYETTKPFNHPVTDNDHLSLHHAVNHLQRADNDQIQKDATIGALDEIIGDL